MDDTDTDNGGLSGGENGSSSKETKLFGRLHTETTFTVSSTSLQLPPTLKLKSEENYPVWKTMMVDLATSNGLDKYINVRACKNKPRAIEWDDDKASTEDYNK